MDNCWDDLVEALKGVDVLTINDDKRQMSGGRLVRTKIMTMGPISHHKEG